MVLGLIDSAMVLCDAPIYAIRPTYAQGDEARVIYQKELEVLTHLIERRPVPPPFDVLGSHIGIELSERWEQPCEAAFEYLASRHPVALAKLIESGGLGPADLTFAAEFLGRLASGLVVRRTLLPLLEHSSATVREGAIYGIQRHLDDEVRSRLSVLARTDPSFAVREAASDALEGL